MYVTMCIHLYLCVVTGGLVCVCVSLCVSVNYLQMIEHGYIKISGQPVYKFKYIQYIDITTFGN